MKVLLVEDDDLIYESLSEALINKGYEVVCVDNGNDVKEVLNHTVDLIILDIQLPDINGIDLCVDIRKHYDIPILFLSCLNNEDSIVDGLNAGGDDYVTKPFSLKELYARIESLTRRFSKQKDIIIIDDLMIDSKNYIVYKNNEKLELSLVLYNLLYALVNNKTRVLTRDYLIEMIEDLTDHYIDSNTLSVHIKRLRKILGDYNGEEYIETLRGVGYRWHIS